MYVCLPARTDWNGHDVRTIRRESGMRTLYDRIEEAVDAKANAERFLNDGLENKILMRLNDGTIRPRYCQYCEEEYGHLIIPKIQCWEFNLSAREVETIRKAGKQEWDHFWKDVKNRLKLYGYDTDRYVFLPAMLTNGKQYACFCDCCGHCSGWYRTQKDAMDKFDRIIREQVEYSRDKGFDDEE